MACKFSQLLCRLNGWQRLWLVISAIALGASVLYIYTFIPTEVELREEARLQIESLRTDRDLELRKISDHCHSIAKNDPHDLFNCLKANNQFQENLHNQFKEHRQQILDQSEKQIAEILPYNRAHFISITLGTWALLSSALYVTGILAAWIKLGFRKNNYQQPPQED